MTFEELSRELSSLRSRGEIKRYAKRLNEDTSLRLLLIEVLQKREYHSLEEYSSKKLIRLFLDRSSDSQIRKNPIFVDEGFECDYCSQIVPIGGVMIRDHCPFCLWGRHLDRIPGDRSAKCSGMMKPESFEVLSGNTWIHYCCTSCAHRFRVRAHPDDRLVL